MNTSVPLDWQGPIDQSYSLFEDMWLDQPIFSRFQQWVRETPNAVAVRDSFGSLTYADLDLLIRQWATGITRYASPQSPVAVAVSMDRFYPAAMLAVLACGCPYVPLDLNFPVDRLRHILTHSGSDLILVDAQTRSIIEGVCPPCVRCIDCSEWACDPAWVPVGCAQDVAYILYTSGSTGIPKGVYQSQRGLMHDILQYTRSVHIGSHDRLSGLYSPSVGGGLRDIYGALLNGATLGVMDIRKQGFRAIATMIDHWGITILHTMPPILRGFLRTLSPQIQFNTVRLVYLAGDSLYASDLSQFRTHFDEDTFFYTGIGSTECATLYRQWFIPKTYEPTAGRVPVGYPIPEREVTLEDSGEIVVHSAYLSMGYWKDSEQTQLRFLSDLSGGTKRVFRTGDIGHCHPDGLLDFLGRKDRQIKIRGFRVEPGELEAVCRTVSGVLDSAVVVRQDKGDSQLIAYVMVKVDLDAQSLRSQLHLLLPAHLWPSEVIILPSLPVLGNFKMDYSALMVMDTERQQLEKTSVAFSNSPPAIFDSFFEVCREVLGGKLLSDDLSFAALDIDSLKLLMLYARLEAVFQTSFPLEWMISDIPFRELIPKIQAFALVDIPKNIPRLLLFPPPGGVSKDLIRLGEAMAPDIAAITIDYRHGAKINPHRFDIEIIADQCIEDYAVHFNSDNELILFGYSFGARVAYAVAHRLSVRGRVVKLLILGDCYLVPPLARLRASPSPEDKLRHLRQVWYSVRFCMGLLLIGNYLGVQLISSKLLVKIKRPVQMEKLARKILFLRKIKEWKPLPYDLKTCLLVTDFTLEEGPDLTGNLGWGSLCSNLIVQRVPGGHADFFSFSQS